jgi:type III restriction enzyme
MQDIKVFNTTDLVLNVTQNYDPTKLDLSEWTRFLDILCLDRNYQKEAIKKSIIFLFSSKYESIESLIKENYNKNEHLQTRYKDLLEYHKKLQLPKKLAATIDLATGTGKSYVMYGIAQIALGLGLIDRVLLLCPSITIEKGLTEKFLELATNSNLKNAIPESSKYKNPRIIDATQTIKNGDICIENIHAVYFKNNTSIQDSLGYGKGGNCLILNDEAHHIFNKISGNDTESKGLKKWKEFLLDENHQFRYIMGFTGTAYIENEYFNDVIYRYSLRQAIEDRIVKTVFYVSKDEQTQERNERFQKIYQNHQANKEKYVKIKPLTILITQEISLAKQLTEELCEFLADKENVSIEEIRQNKVLIVTSKHPENISLYLPNVDKPESPFEWIVSVSMLTEGWDVKNVFQIVPMEERAFNSKLLIAQVLGRGLRLPQSYPQAQVTVFNHDNWTGKIKKLVDEILEIEMKLVSNSLSDEKERAKYHFSLHNFSYEKTFEEIPTQETKTFDYTKGFIEFTSQVNKYKTSTDFVNTLNEVKEVYYTIDKEMFLVSDIVKKIYEEFRIREWEGITLKLKDGEYTKNNLPPKETIEQIIRNSMQRREIEGDFLDRRNRQAVFNSFNTLLRKKPKTLIPKKIVTAPFEISTNEREQESLSISNLRKDSSVFYTIDWIQEIENEECKIIFDEIVSDESLPRKAPKEINSYLFKTPIDITFTSSEPERKFVDMLCKKENAEKLMAWFKSKSQGFYEIEYTTYTNAGRHTNQHKFNPDFFIQIEREDKKFVVVIEIKADNDDSDENRAKHKYAKQHFSDLNS